MDIVDLKKLLMELGNALVSDFGFDPCIVHEGMRDEVLAYKDTEENSTLFIALLTVWINKHPEVQEVLWKMGFKWSMPEKTDDTT